MKHWTATFVAILTAFSLAATVVVMPAYAASTQAAAPAQNRNTPHPYRIEGKIIGVYKGWVQIDVTKVSQGMGIKVGEKLRIDEGSKVKIFQAGKPVDASKLMTGEVVTIVGQSWKTGAMSRYSATTMTVMK